MSTEPLVCHVDHVPPLAYVSVRGRLDSYTAPMLRRAVLKALTAEPVAVLIDMADLTDVDPIALNLFLSLSRAAAAWPGSQLINHSAVPSLAGALQALGIGRHVSLVADRAEAEVLAGRPTGPVQMRWDVGSKAEGLAESRDVVRTFCLGHGLDALTGNAELVITELVTNAIVHGTVPITVRASLRRRYLHLAVLDHAPGIPRVTGPDPATRMGGRGLMIVEALTMAWGTTPTPPGKVVWCTLRP